MVCDSMCFDARIDLGSILTYIMCEVLVSNQSYCIIIICESDVRISVGKDSTLWAEAISVASTERAELRKALRIVMHCNSMQCDTT